MKVNKWHRKKLTPEQKEDFINRLEENDVRWRDRFAMILSSLLVIVLPCALILIGISLLTMWLFGLL